MPLQYSAAHIANNNYRRQWLRYHRRAHVKSDWPSFTSFFFLFFRDVLKITRNNLIEELIFGSILKRVTDVLKRVQKV